MIDSKNFNERLPSGIDGLDTILSGGFPSGRTIVISGGPGSGRRHRGG